MKQSKKLACTVAVGLACLTLAQSGFSDDTQNGPTAYGLVNKELRFVTQDKEAAKSDSGVVTDVDGFESHLGVKGQNLGKVVNVNYQAELGLNSAGDTFEERIRTRIVKADLDLKGYGIITVGQDWLPSALNYIQLDPFAGSSAQSFNLDQSYIVGALGYAALPGLGYHFRAFRDQFAYRSPDFYGVSFALSYDANSPHNFDKNSSRGAEANLNYTSDVVDAGAFYFDCRSCDPDKKTNSLGMYTKLKANGIHLALNYGQQILKYLPNTDDSFDKVLSTRVFGALSYNSGPLVVMGSYSKADINNKDYDIIVDQVTKASINYKNAKQTQVAVGAKYLVADKTYLRGHIAQTHIKNDDLLFADKYENKAVATVLGVQVGF